MQLKKIIPLSMRKLGKEYWQRIRPPQVVLTAFDSQGCKFEITTKAEKYRILAFGGEEALIRRFLSDVKTGEIIFDIGSSVGMYSIHAARRGARVFAFEPDPYYRKRLRRNISLNKLKNQIQVIEWAVSDKKAYATLFTDGVQGNSPSLARVGERGSVSITTDSIDNAIAQGLLPRPHIVKIDIEGAEILALRGMKTLLSSNIAPRLIYIELHPDFLEGFSSSVEECMQIFEAHGYKQAFLSPRAKQLHAIYHKNISLSDNQTAI